MFKFNFEAVDAGSSDAFECSSSDKASRLAEEHDPTNVDFAYNTESLVECKVDDACFRYLKQSVIEQHLLTTSIGCVLHSSDLKSGYYEGGGKIWECTFDLLKYMSTQGDIVNDAYVLDLGCGTGLLGIYACLKGAKHICLQDYNSEVVEFATIPSYYHSLHDRLPDWSKRATFVSGDWDQVCDLFIRKGTKKFDIILSSETVYNPRYYSKLLRLLDEMLSYNGHAYFAAKSYYFGVGGGSICFREYLCGTGRFIVNLVFTSDFGLCREILQVSHATQNDMLKEI